MVKIEATSVLKEECSSHFCEVSPTGGINVGIKSLSDLIHWGVNIQKDKVRFYLCFLWIVSDS